LRGGAFGYGARYVRCAARSRGTPNVGSPFRGFRVVVASPF